MVKCSILFATFMNWTVRGINNPRELETFHENQSSKVILLCPQCHMISNHKVQRINTSLVISNHSRKETTVGPPNFIFYFPQCILQYTLRSSFFNLFVYLQAIPSNCPALRFPLRLVDLPLQLGTLATL